MKLSSLRPESSRPIILGTKRSPASIVIRFPNGTYEYVLYDNRFLDWVLKKYRRSPGKMVAYFKKAKVEVHKL